MEKLQSFIIKQLDDMKIEDIKILDVKNKSSLTDFIILGTGRSEKHIESSLEKLRTSLKQEGIYKNIPVVEGEPSNWILLDLNSVIVHLFTEESRKLYDLDTLWGK